MKDAGIATALDPEEVISVIESESDDLRSWDGQQLHEWAERPYGRPGTAEKLSEQDQFGRLVALDQISSIMADQMKPRESVGSRDPALLRFAHTKPSRLIICIRPEQVTRDEVDDILGGSKQEDY